MNQVAVDMKMQTVSWRARAPSSSFSSSSSSSAPVPLKSEKEFPSLGSKHVAINVLPPPIKLPVLDFKGTVEKMIASASASASTVPKKAPIQPKKTQVLPPIGFCDRIEYEENFPDYEREELMEEGQEYNASIFSNRRRGDNGVW